MTVAPKGTPSRRGGRPIGPHRPEARYVDRAELASLPSERRWLVIQRLAELRRARAAAQDRAEAA